MMGQLATFLYSRLAHKEATGNSAYFFEYKPHLTFIQSCLSFKRTGAWVKSWIRYFPTKHLDEKCRPNIWTILSTLCYKTEEFQAG